MATNVSQLKIAAPEFKLKRGVVKCESGLTLTKMATAIYDTALSDSSGVSNKTTAAHGLGVFLPIGSIVVRAWYQVKTTFTSATSAATIALKATGTGDLVAGIAINDGSAPWTAGLHGCLPGNYAEATVAGDTAILAAARAAGSYLGPMSAEKELIATVGVEALTAGKLALFVEYVQGL